MKTVFSNANSLGHLWAHQTQSHAKAGNVSFSGNAFVSYSTVIAMVVESPAGERCYLLTDHSYSNSTAKHKNIASRAIPTAAKRFYVPVTTYGWSKHPEVKADHEFNASMWDDEIKSQLALASESREPKKSRMIVEAFQAQASAQEYIDYFALAYVLPAFPFTSEQVSTMAAEIEAKRTRASIAACERNRALRALPWDEQHRIKQQHRIEKAQASIAAWLNGKGNNSELYDVPTMLRVKGDMIETSRGATFPISHAKRGLVLVDAVKARNEAWQRNGHTCHLGHYQIDSIDPDGTVHAGCHVVSYAAIERIKEAILSAPAKAGE